MARVSGPVLWERCASPPLVGAGGDKRDAAAQGLSLGELLRQRMKTAGALK